MMNTLLWIAQIALAGIFGMFGFMKTFMYEAMRTANPDIVNTPRALITFIGVVELLGALGMLLPMLLRVKPGLTPLAALGFCIVMVLAAATHIMQGEYPGVLINAALFALAAFVAYGRWKVRPSVAPSGQLA